MRLALLTGAAAALSLIGAASAQAEIIYSTDAPYYGYAYTAPAPVLPAPGYVVAEPRDYVVVTPPPVYAPSARYIPGPRYVAPRYVAPRYVAPTPRVVVNRPVAREEIVTTGYSAGSCFIDLAGVERCY